MNVNKGSLKFLYGVFAVFALLLIVGMPETVKAEESPYYIRVNRQQNVVTVYEKDENGEYNKPVKAMTCSTGVNNATPTGTFKLSMRYRWHELDGKVYGQYCSRISGHILFHSVFYNDTTPDSLSYNAYNRLGTQASHGCVRLSVADSKWIFDNCPSGTVVTIYDDKDNPGPLGKPDIVPIDTSSACRGWDPTDPDKDNPWKKAAPVIKGAEDKTVESGSPEPDWTKGVTAVDYKGKEVKVKAASNCDMNVAGTYKVTYTAKDSRGNVAKKKITVIVTDVDKPDIETVKENISVDSSFEGKLEKELKENVRAKDNGKKLSSDYITVEAEQLAKAVQEKKYGVYEVKAYATDSSGNKSETVTFYVKYTDTSQQEKQKASDTTAKEKDVGKVPELKDSGQSPQTQIGADRQETKTDTGGYIDTSPDQNERTESEKLESKNSFAKPRGSTEYD